MRTADDWGYRERENTRFHRKIFGRPSVVVAGSVTPVLIRFLMGRRAIRAVREALGLVAYLWGWRL